MIEGSGAGYLLVTNRSGCGSGRHRNKQIRMLIKIHNTSVADPDPDSPDTRVFGPPGSGSFYHHAKLVRKNLIPTILRLFLNFYLCKNFVNLASKSHKLKKLC
jgi:hypothetical protein